MSSPHVPNGQLSCLLHIYMLSRIQWTWFGVIQSGSVCSIMFTKSKTQRKSNFVPVGKSKCAQWAIRVSVAHLHVKTNTMNFIWSDSEQKFLIYIVYKVKNAKKKNNFLPVGKSKCTQWAIRVSVAHLHVETKTMNFLWSDSEQ